MSGEYEREKAIGMTETATGDQPSGPFQTVQVKVEIDEFAPDTSEIRVLGRTARGSTAHGTLPVGATALALKHKTIDEIWFVVSGRAEIWRRLGDQEEVIEAGPGTSLTLPVGTHFQFRTLGEEPFRFVMFTMPPWPGDEEAVRVDDYWPV